MRRVSRARRPKERKPASSTRRRRGRPILHDEPWSKVSVVLFDRQVLRLDRTINDIRRQNGGVLNRAALIRGLLDGVFDSRFGLSSVLSENDLRRKIARHLSGRSSS